MDVISTLVIATIILGWVATIMLVLAWFRRGRLTWGQQVVADMDAFVEEEKQTRVVPKWSMDAAMAAKAKFGELKYNNANRMIVDGYIRKWLKEEQPDMRTIDIVRFTPIAVELALTPTTVAVRAHEYSQDRVVQARRSAITYAK